MPARLSVSANALSDFADALAAHGQAAPATLVAQIAREVADDEVAQRAAAPCGKSIGKGVVARAQSAQHGDARYVWAFRRLSDALTAMRANHRSDYHAYPHPQTLREASLDRLYQRFPLTDYPRTTALLFTGARICEDPRLWADPRADTLVSAAPAVVVPEEWERYTVCGFRQGVALVRVSEDSRWLRVGAHALEDAWAAANQEGAALAAYAPARRGADGATAIRTTMAGARVTAETLARDTLLRAAPAEAFMTLAAEAGAAPTPAAEAQASSPGGAGSATPGKTPALQRATTRRIAS